MGGGDSYENIWSQSVWLQGRACWFLIRSPQRSRVCSFISHHLHEMMETGNDRVIVNVCRSEEVCFYLGFSEVEVCEPQNAWGLFVKRPLHCFVLFTGVWEIKQWPSLAQH